MKKFILSLFLVLFSNYCFSEEIISIVKIGPGVVEKYDDAISLSKETNNKIFIYFGADWCPHCVSMKNGTLSEDGVKKKILKNYIFLDINVDDNKALKEKYNIKLLPSYIIINEKEEVLKESSGYKSPKNFSKWLED